MQLNHRVYFVSLEQSIAVSHVWLGD